MAIISLTLASVSSKAPEPERASGVTFVDATASSRIRFKNVCGAPPRQKLWLTEGMGAGAAWLDYDGDGKLDLYLVNGSTHSRTRRQGEPNRLFRGDGHGHFQDVTEAARVGDRGWGYGVAVGDIDNDGHPDIYVTNLGANVLYHNNGNGTFTDITARAGVAAGSWSTSAAFFDMDADGDLDLYVGRYVDFDARSVPARGSKEANRITCMLRGIPVFCGPLGLTPLQDILYRNNGDGTFTDVTRAAGVMLDMPLFALGVVTGDFDNDGDQDIYVANDSGPNLLWRNHGDGTFEEVGMATLSALSGEGMAQAGMGTDFGDYDNDGWLDAVVTNFSSDLNTVYHNESGQFFTDQSLALGLGVTFMDLSWGTGFYDFDNDGRLDLFIANGHVYPQVDDFSIGTTFRQTNALFMNKGSRFEKAPATDGLSVVRSFRGAALGDYDDDGDVDILVTALDDSPLLLRNDTAGKGRFLEVRLVGGSSPGALVAGIKGAVAPESMRKPADLRSGEGAHEGAAPSASAHTVPGDGEHTPRVTGRGDGKAPAGGRFSNRDGIGARVTVVAGGIRQIRERKGGGSYLSSPDPRLHFGLGDATKVDSIEVRWPSGRTEVFRDVPADRIITIKEGTGESAGR